MCISTVKQYYKKYKHSRCRHYEYCCLFDHHPLLSSSCFCPYWFACPCQRQVMFNKINNLALFSSPVLFTIVKKPHLLHCILYPVLIDGMMPSSALYMISPRHWFNKQGYSKYTWHMPTIVEKIFILLCSHNENKQFSTKKFNSCPWQKKHSQWLLFDVHV